MNSIRDRVVELRRVPASDLKPNRRNWRKHPQAQSDALRGVLREIGFAGAELARQLDDGSLELIDGHLRAGIAGDQPIPVLVLDVSESEAAKLLVTFDPLSAMAEADTTALDALLREVETGDEAVAKMLADLGRDAGCAWAKEQAAVIEDEVPEPPADPVTKVGDLWLLGEHRLLCGDSSNREQVGRLFAGARASLWFTSPPYAQQRDYGAAKEIVQDWDGLMRGVFQHAPAVMETDGQILVNLGLIHRDGEWVPYWEQWIQWMREQGWRRFGWYVWDQMHGLRGDWSGRCAPSHEFLFHFNRQSVKPQKFVPSSHAGERGGALRGRNGLIGEVTTPTIQPFKLPDSVWRVQRQKGGIEGHPAPFSVGLAAMALQSWPGLAYESFSGSGTTIIAAEQLNRRCYAIELEPRYVDVAVARWEKLTGRKADLQTV